MTNVQKLFMAVVVLWVLALSALFISEARECRGQCFQTHDRGCEKRCFDKGICPMAGGDQ